MKLAVLAMLPLLAAVPANGLAQTPPSPTQKPPAAIPAQPQPQKPAAPRKTTPPAAAPTTITFTVTDPAGAPLSEVRVNLIGALDRSGSTGSDGTIKFDGLRPGPYRLRFTKEGFTLLEREIEIKAGVPPPAPAVTLTPAPPPPAPPPPPKEEPKPASMPPPGQPISMVLPDFIERNLISGSQPQKVSPVACSGMSNTQLWQVREPWTDRQHAAQDATLYIIAGEGLLHLDGRDTPVAAGSFAAIPRGMSYSLTRKGRSPLIALATLVGEPCNQ